MFYQFSQSPWIICLPLFAPTPASFSLRKEHFAEFNPSSLGLKYYTVITIIFNIIQNQINWEITIIVHNISLRLCSTISKEIKGNFFQTRWAPKTKLLEGDSLHPPPPTQNQIGVDNILFFCPMNLSKLLLCTAFSLIYKQECLYQIWRTSLKIAIFTAQTQT